MPKPSTPAQYILILIDMVESQGCDRDRYCAGTSLAERALPASGRASSDMDFARLVTNAQA